MSKTAAVGSRLTPSKPSLIRRIRKDLPFHVMVWLGIAFVIVFCYIPMTGVIIAFKNYGLRQGIFGSPWVGLAYFKNMFTDYYMSSAVINTIGISVLSILISFPLTIVFALLLNELSNKPFQRIVQTVSFLPHFISWAVMAIILDSLLNPGDGIINGWLMQLGLINSKIFFLGEPKYYWGIVVISSLWKEYGWNSIVYLAVLSGVDSNLYEAAIIDGASRWQRVRYISFPALRGIISITLMLRMGSLVSTGFEQSFFLINSLNYERANVLSYYVYEVGLRKANFSYSAAIGLVLATISATLLLTSNSIVKKINGEGLY